MARLLRAWRSWRAFNSINCPQHHPSPSPTTTTSTSSSSSLSLHRFYGQRTRHSFECNIHPKTHEVLRLNPTAELPRFCSMLPAVLAGVLGMGMLEMSHADANNADSQNWSASQSPSNFMGMSGVVSHERQRLEELLRNRGMKPGSYPPFTIAVKGQQVTIKFRIPPKCELSHLIVSLASRLGHKAEEHGGSSEMIIRAWDSAVAWQLTLTTPTKSTESGEVLESHEVRDKLEGSLYILLFKSLIDSESAEIEFIKQGSFSFEELDTLVSALRLASERSDSRNASEKRPSRYSERRESRPNSAPVPSGEKSLDALEAMGVKVFGLSEPFPVPSNGVISWDSIAGYDQQKRGLSPLPHRISLQKSPRRTREIEDTILLALHSPEVYDDIARGTRCKFESNRPRAVLFEGPPGTGKTSCARVIANHAGVPLLYVPLEVVMSKYYGESERLLGTIFSLANELSGGAIIFLDEVDSFAIARGNEMHEATRRILSVLLRQIDGFEQEKRVVVIAATNRKQDLDPALISRFDSMITFGLPDQQTREKIAAQYAKHLKKSELVQFATVTEGMSGRDIRDVCQQAERRWASKIIRGEAVPSDDEHGYLPPIQEYIENSEHRQKSLLDITNDINRKSRPELTKKPLALA